MHSSVLSTVVPIHSLPSWHSKLLQSMPTSHHLLSSCTNANLELPSLPKSATLTQQPFKFMNRLLPTLDTFKSQADKHCKSLAPLYAGQLVAMYDTLCKIWVPITVVHVLPKDSYQVCTSAGMVYCCTRQHFCESSVKPADTVPDTTATTLQTPARPHVSVPQPAHTYCTCNSTATDHSCSQNTNCPKGHPCTYTCDTQCSPCAVQKIRSCPGSTQAPDTGDVTILQPMRGDP